ncbi:hypothetical protein FA13DRAFT_236022 [Coprinellus micaceus]|uniref:Uncharacterized protein n=1 Tax=Coprinellus micaceus TaxID=71717 RepID=A0A4Y7SFK0_COPMI|nr:hypothetical protein FA13DRAFT_236022 [Coprinellus micaceus]
MRCSEVVDGLLLVDNGARIARTPPTNAENKVHLRALVAHGSISFLHFHPHLPTVSETLSSENSSNSLNPECSLAARVGNVKKTGI